MPESVQASGQLVVVDSSLKLRCYFAFIKRRQSLRALRQWYGLGYIKIRIGKFVEVDFFRAALGDLQVDGSGAIGTVLLKVFRVTLGCAKPRNKSVGSHFKGIARTIWSVACPGNHGSGWRFPLRPLRERSAPYRSDGTRGSSGPACRDAPRQRER